MTRFYKMYWQTLPWNFKNVMSSWVLQLYFYYNFGIFYLSFLFLLHSGNWCLNSCMGCLILASAASVKLVTDHFVWPNMNSNVQNWVSSCLDCQKCKVHCTLNLQLVLSVTSMLSSLTFTSTYQAIAYGLGIPARMIW